MWLNRTVGTAKVRARCSTAVASGSPWSTRWAELGTGTASATGMGLCLLRRLLVWQPIHKVKPVEDPAHHRHRHAVSDRLVAGAVA